MHNAVAETCCSCQEVKANEMKMYLSLRRRLGSAWRHGGGSLLKSQERRSAKKNWKNSVRRLQHDKRDVQKHRDSYSTILKSHLGSRVTNESDRTSASSLPDDQGLLEW